MSVHSEDSSGSGPADRSRGPDARPDDRRLILLLGAATVPVVLLSLSAVPLPAAWVGLSLTQWHTVLEVASMLLCGAITSVVWNARQLEIPRGVLVLGSACAGCVVLDLAHTLTFPGMPNIAVSDPPTRTIVFGLASRSLIALALLGVAVLPWRTDARRDRRWAHRASLGIAAFVAAVFVFLLGWPQAVPAPARQDSLTLIKLSAEGCLAGTLIAAAVFFARRLRGPQPLDIRPLLCAAVLMALGDGMLMLYSRLNDLAIMAGHVYKVLGFWLVHRAIVADSMRRPYARLHESQEEARRSEEELRTITDNIPALVSYVDTGQRYMFVNLNYLHWLGQEPRAMIGRTIRQVQGEERYVTLEPHIARALHGEHFNVNVRLNFPEPKPTRWLNTNYMPRKAADGSVVGVYILSSDITDVMAAERRALFLSEYDELTTLPNRATFQLAVGRSLERSARDGSQFAVIFVDVDRFKVINDTLGHAAGDHLLQTLAQRMKQVVRGQDLVARMGGDEMCLLLHDVRDASHASEIAGRILGALREPVELRTGVQHHVTVSAGIAIYPSDGTDVATLLRHADIAMYRAKAAGRDGFAIFGTHDGGPAEARLNLELELRTAIDEGQFVLHYQPRVDVITGVTLGVEALVRWQHPQRGLLAPGHFIDIAEETGLIVPMGAWVLREAGRMLRRLHCAEGPLLAMSVNVSARQFRNPHLIDEVTEMLTLAGCAPHLIELELTESAVMDQPDIAEATMRRLKTLGVRLSMDDFGTGYSSLAALKRFPVDCVKIDRSFVHDIPADIGDAALTRAIIAMGHSLGLHVVAEGVERVDQLDFLRLEGCDEYQGYHYARPLSEETLVELLAAARTAAFSTAQGALHS